MNSNSDTLTHALDRITRITPSMRWPSIECVDDWVRSDPPVLCVLKGTAPGWVAGGAALLSTDIRNWLWPTFREVICPGVSCGVMITGFVIMLAVRS